MSIIGIALALLAIVAGMMLLFLAKKENLSNLYKYVGWFVVGMGFLCILGVAGKCAMRCCRQRMQMREYRMMGNDGFRGGMMGRRGMMGGRGMMNGGGCMMMGGNCDQMGDCHEGMNECHEGMMGGQCKEGMSECHEGMMGGECKEGMNGGTCPMMGGHCNMTDKKDSVKKK
ncbi:MAG TPA: hypothetical protein VNZ45_02315 [Bacteroidia bacterium]|jgi:hypothetical protein|nr:hypothetical protein [Bacteroidia bacterium]